MFTLLLAIFVLASAQAPRLERTCGLYLITNDNDPKGLNVRSGPGQQYPVIKVVKSQTDVTCSGFSRGWVYCTEGFDGGDSWTSGGFKGGFIHSSKLITMPDTEFKDVTYYELPSTSSRVLFATKANESPQAKLEFVSCDRGWTRVRYIEKKITGWVQNSQLCANSFSNCS